MPAFREEGLSSVVASPLDLVRGLFTSADHPARDRADDWGVEEYFTKLLSDQVTREQVSRTATVPRFSWWFGWQECNGFICSFQVQCSK